MKDAIIYFTIFNIFAWFYNEIGINCFTVELLHYLYA